MVDFIDMEPSNWSEWIKWIQTNHHQHHHHHRNYWYGWMIFFAFSFFDYCMHYKFWFFDPESIMHIVGYCLYWENLSCNNNNQKKTMRIIIWEFVRINFFLFDSLFRLNLYSIDTYTHTHTHWMVVNIKKRVYLPNESMKLKRTE